MLLNTQQIHRLCKVFCVIANILTSARTRNHNVCSFFTSMPTSSFKIADTSTFLCQSDDTTKRKENRKNCLQVPLSLHPSLLFLLAPSLHCFVQGHVRGRACVCVRAHTHTHTRMTLTHHLHNFRHCF